MHINAILYTPINWKALTTYLATFVPLDIPIVRPSAESQNLAFNKIVTRGLLSIEGIKFAPGCIIKYEEKD